MESPPPCLWIGRREQLSFYWVHGPAEASLFPYWEFTTKAYTFASEITFLMIAFLIGHEMAHLSVPVASVENTEFSGVEENARGFIEVIPPPFFDHPPHPKWKEFWVEEFLCDALAAMSIMSITREDGVALPNAPAIGTRALLDRYLAIEAVTLHVEALFWNNTLKGSEKALLGSFGLYSKTHPLPNLRRVFIRGFAEQILPDYRTVPKLYEAAMRKLSPMPR